MSKSWRKSRSVQAEVSGGSPPTTLSASAAQHIPCHAAVNQVCSLAALQWQGLEKVLRRFYQDLHQSRDQLSSISLETSSHPSVKRPALIHQSRDQLSSSSRGPASHQPESRLPPARQATARLRPISHGIVIYILPISQKWIGIRDFTSFQWWHWRHKFWLLC